jgi:release factor glutamine methyltransferase
VEAGHDQSEGIAGLMAAAGLTQEWPAKADLAGIRRAVAARKMPP